MLGTMSLFHDSGGRPRHKSMSANVRRLQEALNMHLDVQEKSEFVSALNEYHVTREIPLFVKNLKQILTTPAKWQLVPLIRKVIPKMDVEVFDQFTQYDKKKYGTMPMKGFRKGNNVLASDFMKILPTKKKPKLFGKREAESDSMPSFRDRSLRNDLPGKTASGKSVKSLQSAMKGKGSEVRRIQIKRDTENGFGFSIRGGSEYGLGVYVSSVDRGGMAEEQGLVPGDLLLEVNDISFSKISHNEGAKIIKAARRLDLTICRVGRIPGSFVVHQMYKWVDPNGRPVSPPPELEQIGQLEGSGSVSRKSGFSLLKASDERKVNVSVKEGAGLGLMIRGGREFGLGIYISGVDAYSMAENAGLKVGDQILDVNGQSFLDITHAEAVRVLKTSKHAIFTIKDVGKLPYARTTIDKTNWVNRREHRTKSDSQVSGSSRNQSRAGSAFSKGIGSQLMLNSTVATKWDVIENQARQLLNETEQGTLRYYLHEYQKGFITIDGLTMASFELLNTKAKMTLMSEIRHLVDGSDLEKFDTLLQRREIQQRQGYLPESYSTYSLNGISGGYSRNGRGSTESPLSSQQGHHSQRDTLLKVSSVSAPVSRATTLRDRPRSRRVVTESDLEPLRLAIEQIEDDPDFLPEFLPQDDSDSTLVSTRLKSRSTEQLASSSRASVSSLATRRSVSMEKLGLLTIDTSSSSANLPQQSNSQAIPRQRSNSNTSQRSRLGSNASQRIRANNNYAHRQRSGSNSSSIMPPRMFKSMEDISQEKTRVLRTTPYPSRHNSMEDIRSQLSTTSMTHMKHLSNYPPSHASQVVVAEVHHAARAADGSPSDDSGVEVNGNHDNQVAADRVTISAERPVDIDDVLERRSSVVAMSSPDLRQNSRSSVFETINSGADLKTISVSGLSNDNFTLHPKSNIEIRINDGEGSIESLRYDSNRQPKFIEDDQRSVRSMRSRDLKMFEDDEAEIFDLRSEMGDDIDFYIGPLDRVLSEVDLHGDAKHIQDARKKYGNIPLELTTIYKTKPTLGMAIEGGANTRQPLPRVINLQPGGSAYESGGLKLGHVILEVNGESLVGLEHIEAAKMIAEAFKNKSDDHMELLVTEGDVVVSNPNVSNIVV